MIKIKRYGAQCASLSARLRKRDTQQARLVQRVTLLGLNVF